MPLHIKLVSVFLLLMCLPALAEDQEFKAIRSAADSIADSVVQIETIGASATPGELSLTAPISGAFVDSEGHIITSLWGLEETPASILVVLADGTRLPAEIVARDYNRELVLLKADVADKETSVATARTTSDVHVGQWAIAVGRGISPEHASISVGIVSATDRMHGRAIQIDARISPSYYGGPVVNIKGELIGFSVPMVPQAGSSGEKSGWYDSGIAFVIPSQDVVGRLETLKSGVDIRPGKMGIVPAEKKPFSTNTNLSAVLALSPAKRAGVQSGDQLLAIDSKPVRRVADIKQLLGPRDAGEVVSVLVRRGDQEISIDVKLADKIATFRPRVLGFLPKLVDGKIAVDYVFPESPAHQAQLQKNDVLLELDSSPIGGLDQLRLLVTTHPANEQLELKLERDGVELTKKCQPALIPPTVIRDLPGPENPLSEDELEVSERSLPDAPNSAMLIHPQDATEGDPLGLLVLLMRPGDDKLKATVEPWLAQCAKHRLAVLAIGASQPKRWKPEETDVIIRLIQQTQAGFPIGQQQVAVGGFGAGAEMALMVAMRNREIIRGAVVPASTRPGGFSLKENDPSNPIQILIAGGSKAPIWGNVINKAGFPVIHQFASPNLGIHNDQPLREAVARWLRSLDRI